MSAETGGPNPEDGSEFEAHDNTEGLAADEPVDVRRRVLHDAELVRGGADAVVDKDGLNISPTEQQIARMHTEMERDQAGLTPGFLIEVRTAIGRRLGASRPLGATEDARAAEKLADNAVIAHYLTATGRKQPESEHEWKAVRAQVEDEFKQSYK